MCSSTRAVLVTENHCKHEEQLLSGHSYIYIYTEGSASDIFNSSFHAVNTLFFFEKSPGETEMGRDPRGQRGASVSPPLSWKWCWLHSARIDLTTWYLKATKGLHTAPAERKTLLSLYPFRLLPRAAGAQKGVEKKKKKKGQFFGCAFFHNTGFPTHPYLCLSSASRGFLCLFEYWKVTILLKISFSKLLWRKVTECICLNAIFCTLKGG